MNITKYYRAMREGGLCNRQEIRVGDVVEVLNQDGEVEGNLGFCARGARGRVTSIYSGRVTIDINGKDGYTRLSNVIRYHP
jgi:hypothetical protein